MDGFNFYFGVVKGTPFKWLNLSMMCNIILPRHDIRSIKYFTALVKPWPQDPEQPQRQKLYIRALETLPLVTVVYGHFSFHSQRVWIGTPGNLRREVVMEPREKRSDVNLATHLLVDAFEDAFDQAVVVSTDSGLVLPIRMVREKLGKRVGILKPARRPLRGALTGAADFVREIRDGALRRSQFPTTLVDRRGTFCKPSSW